MHLIELNCCFLPWWQPSADTCIFAYIALPQEVIGKGNVKVKSGRCKVKVKSGRTHGPQDVTDACGWIELLLAFMVADPCGVWIVVAIHP